MAAISEHLRHRPYQVSIARDRTLPARKWKPLGTRWEVSHRSAAYSLGLAGSIVLEHTGERGVVFEFSSGEFVQVCF